MSENEDLPAGGTEVDQSTPWHPWHPREVAERLRGICRRERTIRRPYTDVIKTTKDGIPYMVPEIVLLFKTKHDRAKDNADFAEVLPSLDQLQRSWLMDALQRVHPGHHWLLDLEG